jgi:hypothetical protein
MVPKWAKEFAKGLIRYSVRRLPVRAKTVAFLELCSESNIVGLCVRGEYGVISQSTADRFVLPDYARTGRWATDTNERLIAFFATRGGNVR